MKARKILVSVAALALVAAISIGGTLAYLTSTAKVENTFTVGNVSITLDEAKVNEYGTKVENADRVPGNEYKLIPGHTYTKDPTIHVGGLSENCYLFVKVENGLGDAESTIATQMVNLGWKPVDNQTGVYAWYGKTGDDVNATRAIVAAGANVTVFNNFTFDNLAVPTEYTNAKIVVTAYAIQADGLAKQTDTDLWAKFNA